MNQCPNFNDYRWKYLVKTRGELEAYKYWHQHNGSLASVELSVDELLEAAKEHRNELSFPMYEKAFDMNPAQFLKEMSEQLHSSPSEAEGARRVLGPNLSKIAIELYPTKDSDIYKQALEQSDYNLPINYTLKIVNALRNDKIANFYKRFFNSDRDKFYKELSAFSPKQQIDYLKQWVDKNHPKSLDDMITGLLADLSYTVEIDEAKDKSREDYNRTLVALRASSGDTTETNMDNYAQYYSGLTVPGGTNYRENEIRTPNITPSIKGHAQFATAQGIGWFRSDDKIAERGIANGFKNLRMQDIGNGEFSIYDSEQGVDVRVFSSKKEAEDFLYPEKKTRRILEVQSDLFQKGRDNPMLVGKGEQSNEDIYNEIFEDAGRRIDDRLVSEQNRANNFLQLLNKENNWVTFFVKSIIQDSTRKGYEEVLFPSGNTANKIEGQETLEQFIKQKKENIERVEELLQGGDAEWEKSVRTGQYFVKGTGIEKRGEKYYSFYGNEEFEISKETYERDIKEARKDHDNAQAQYKREIEQYRKEIKDAIEGRNKFAAINSFYENTIHNILQKQGYNPTRIKDEYGNEWYKVKLNNELANKTIYLQKQDSNYRLDPANYNVIDKQEKEFAANQSQLANEDKEPVLTSTSNNNPTISLEGTRQDIINRLFFEGDQNKYKEFFLQNLYTHKNNPTTTEIVNNASRLALVMERADLLNMGRLIYKYLYKNSSLSIRVLDQMDQPDAKAYFNRGLNNITFAKNTMGINTIEFEAMTALHELLHGLTFQPWFKQRNQIPLTSEEQTFKKVVDGYYNYFKSLKGAARDSHPFSNSEEFLMGALMDHSFKNHLKSISENESEENPFIRFMKDLLRGFLKLFGINANNSIIDKINPAKFEENMFDALSDYLKNMDRIELYNNLKDEDNRNYGLSFAVTAEGDYESERQKAKGRFTQELTDQVKKTIEKSLLSIKSFGSTIRSRFPESQEGFQTIFRQLNKLENPEYNLDQVDFFFDFTSEISALMNMASNKIKRLYEDTSIADPDYKLKEYENIVSSIRNFDPIIKDIQAVKIKMEQAGIKEPVSEINNMILKREEIEGVYSMGIFPLITSKLVDIVSPASKKAIDIANENLTKLNESLALATKFNNKRRIKEIEKRIKKEQDAITKQFTLNSDQVENWLRGEMGDSNTYSTWMLAAISNPNPIVSGLQKYIRDNIGEIAPKLLDMQNNFQSQIDRYGKETGRSTSKITEFNSPLIQVHKEIDYEKGKDENGNYTYKNVLSLLHAYNNDHIVELQKFKKGLSDLFEEKRVIENDPNLDPVKLAEIIDKINKLKEGRRQFIKDYMEQRYTPEVHDALDMLYDDLGGFSIWDYMGPLIGNIEDVETAIDQEEDDERLGTLYDQLDDLNFQLARLSALYEKSPDSNEYKVAEHLKKRRELLSKYSTYQLTEKGAIKFEAEKARILRKHKSGEISDIRLERWFEDNTVTELTKDYWEEKKRILNSLHNLQTAMGLTNNKNEDLKKLYDGMEEIAKPYRDNNGIINGRDISEDEVRDVKRIEEEIEEIKSNIESANGLTKNEKIRLSNLYNQRSEIIEKINFTWGDTEELDGDLQKINDEIAIIESNKKNVSGELMKEYIKLLKELGKLDERKDTKYYHDEIAERTEQLKWAVDITQMPEKFFLSGATYQKNGNDWIEIKGGKVDGKDKSFIENLYRTSKAEIALKSSDWWKENHITVQNFKVDETYNPAQPGSFSGEWVEEERPIYIWQQTRPRDNKYINEGQPSIKYKKRTIKDEYVNKNYKESISGDVQPKLFGAKDDRFVNQDYKRLVSSSDPKDKATLNYLSFLTNIYLKAQESIPTPRRKGYELPSIRKTELERLFSNSITKGVPESFSRLGQFLRAWNDKVTKNEQDKDVLYGYNDDFTGLVPMKFLGVISAEDQSIDLARSILAFAEESLKRDQLVKSLPLVNAVKDVVNNPDYKPVKTKNGVVQTMRRKYVPKGTGLAIRSSMSNTALQINEMIKSEIYGESMKDIPGVKAINNILGAGAKLMLGFNLNSSIQNYVNAFTQSIMETESKKSGSFTMKNFFQAQKIYYANIHELMSDMGKYGNKSYINQFFDYFGGINFKLYSKNNKTLAAGKVRELVSSLSVPNTITEHMLNYHMGIAISLNYRVKAMIDGKETYIPIFDAFTLKNRKLELKPEVVVTEEDRKEMISRLNSSSRRINGEYGDRILADKFILTKLALFMNRYVIPFTVKRYGARRLDIQDGIRDEGYWRLLGKLLLRDIKSEWYLPPIVSGWKYYTKEEKAAVIKASTEFGFTIVFFLMLRALGGDDNKKLKDNSLLANNLIYALKGIQQQNEAFQPIPGVGFDDLLRKIQNPFPILGKIKNLVNLVNHGSQSLYYELGLPGVDKSDVIYSKKVGWHEPGEFKVMADVEKLVALPQRLMQYMYPDQAVKNLDAMSRIK